jgi:hypothetical protein
MVFVLAAIIFIAGINALALAQDKPAQTPPSTTTPQRVVKPVKEAVDESGAAATEKIKTAPVKVKTQPIAKGEKPEGMPMRPGLHKPAANMLAVCSCGMLIKPTAATKHFTFGDKEYDVCSDYCLQNAQKDPAAAVKTIETHMASVMSPAPMK